MASPRRRSLAFTLGIALAFTVAGEHSAHAQQGDAQAPGGDAEPASEASSDDQAARPATADLEVLRRAVADNRQTIEALQQELRESKQAQEELRASHQASREKAEDATASSPAPEPQEAGLSDHGTRIPHRSTVREDHLAAPRPGNAHTDSAYSGFHSLFGGKVFVKPGGYVKIDAILDSTRVGNPNKLVTASIPVEGEAQYGSPEQFNLHGKQTRLSMDVRWPTSLGSVRVMYENDFYGEGTNPVFAYNLRHLYAQFLNITVGQTWTMFIDPDTIPDSLDFAGPGVQAILRQPQLRYTFSPVHEVLHVAISAEFPESDVAALPSDGTARRMAPDGLLQVRLEGHRGHLQTTGLARAIAYDSTSGSDDAVLGWGVMAAGALQTYRKDTLIASVVYGHGVGRYMQDLGQAYGAYVQDNGKLAAIEVWGMHVGYRHFWLDNLTTQVTYGHIDAVTPAPLGGSAYDLTHYAQGNLVWSPVERLFVGAEYIHGAKRTQNRSDGADHRGQLSFQFKAM